VSIFSGKSLGVADSCVREARLGGHDAYAFGYDGLRLLQVTPGKVLPHPHLPGRAACAGPGRGRQRADEFVPAALNASPSHG
jgi:hypothetical protein